MLVAIFISSSCGKIESNSASYTSQKFQIGINEAWVTAPDYFYETIDEYTQELLASLNVSDIDLSNLNITIRAENQIYRGLYTPPVYITLTDEPKILSVYGHELVRHIFYSQNKTEWNQNSYHWTGEIGEAWNTAENLSLRLPKKIQYYSIAIVVIKKDYSLHKYFVLLESKYQF